MSRAAPSMALAALAALLAAGCASGEDSRDRRSAAEEEREARLERLRALPYVDFAGAEGDTGEDGVVRLDSGRAWEGHSLSMSRTLCRAALIDLRGRPLKEWSHAPCHHWANATLLPGGRLVVVGMDPPAADETPDRLEERYLLLLSWEGEVIWKRYVGAHHDAQPSPGGTITAITARHRREPGFDRDTDIRDNALTRLSAAGKVLEEISLYEILSPGPAGFQLRRAGVERGKDLGAMDLFHANTVHWNPFPRLQERGDLWAPDAVMVTIRNQDTVIILDWSDRKVLWSWGRGELMGPHDATWLESGNILVFDNGLGRGWSRVLEVDPLTKAIAWEFTAPERESFYSASRGGAQRLPNGNTLVTESDRGHAFEVTAEGSVVWEFWNPDRDAEGRRATIFRMRRYDAAATAGLLEARPAGAGAAR